MAALIAIAGVVMVSFSMPSASSPASCASPLGVVLTVGAGALFAAFEVSFKLFGRKHFRFGHQLSETLLFQAFIGISNLLLFWPFVVLLNSTDLEPFRLPSDYGQWLHAIVIPSSLDLLFTASVLCGITLCGAIFVSMGLILVIPFAFFADIIVFKKQSMLIVNAYSVIGAICIVIGFVLIQQNESEKGENHGVHAVNSK